MAQGFHSISLGLGSPNLPAIKKINKLRSGLDGPRDQSLGLESPNLLAIKKINTDQCWVAPGFPNLV